MKTKLKDEEIIKIYELLENANAEQLLNLKESVEIRLKIKIRNGEI